MFRLTSVSAALAIIVALPTPALAWGKTGHRVIGQIADAHLSASARHGVESILGIETLAEASNWPDFMRSDPSPYWQKTASPWHYVTVPPGKTYDEIGAPPEGDAVTALAHFSSVVGDPRTTRTEKQAALRFIVHLVGDLHQPLHVGNGSDKGGNEVQVTYFGKPTNLHSVWDSALIDDTQLSYSEMAAWLNARITAGDVSAWSSTDPKVWIAEGVALRDKIYPGAGETKLSYRYVYENEPRVEGQLERGGVRLAAYLNQLFAPARRRRS